MSPHLSRAMECMVKRAIAVCFEKEPIRRLVFKVLETSGEHRRIDPLEAPKVKRLELLAIRAIMAEKLKDDCCGLVLFSLVFGVPTQIDNFKPDGPREERFMIEHPDKDPKKQIQSMRNDVVLMLAAVEHNLDRWYFEYYTVRIEIDVLRVTTNGWQVAVIGLPEDSPFDTYWAQQFAKLLLSKRIGVVTLELVDYDTESDDNYKREYIEGIINALPRQRPYGMRWEEAVTTRSCPVYWRCPVQVINNFKYTAQFCCDDSYDSSKDYWGYVSDQ